MWAAGRGDRPARGDLAHGVSAAGGSRLAPVAGGRFQGGEHAGRVRLLDRVVAAGESLQPVFCQGVPVGGLPPIVQQRRHRLRPVLHLYVELRQRPAERLASKFAPALLQDVDSQVVEAHALSVFADFAIQLRSIRDPLQQATPDALGPIPVSTVEIGATLAQTSPGVFRVVIQPGLQQPGNAAVIADGGQPLDFQLHCRGEGCRDSATGEKPEEDSDPGGHQGSCTPVSDRSW